MVAATRAAGEQVLASGHYLHWGVVQISLANLLIILSMIVVFVLALLLPFPGGRADTTGEERRDDHD
jgi:hypothetical protein